MTNYAAILVFIVFNSIGFILLRKAMIIRRISREASLWPTTTANILESTIKEDPVRNAMGSVNNTYLVVVKYQYNVNGKQYDGERVAFGNPAFNYMVASNVQVQFAMGNQVPVYYDPKDPSQCVLAPKTTIGMPSLIPGIFLMVIGVLVPLISVFL